MRYRYAGTTTRFNPASAPSDISRVTVLRGSFAQPPGTDDTSVMRPDFDRMAMQPGGSGPCGGFIPTSGPL